MRVAAAQLAAEGFVDNRTAAGRSAGSEESITLISDESKESRLVMSEKRQGEPLSRRAKRAERRYLEEGQDELPIPPVSDR